MAEKLIELAMAVLYGLAGVFFLFVLPRKMKQRSESFLRFFGGRLLWPFGPIEFEHLGFKVRIAEMSSGRGVHGGGGHFLLLWCYVEKTEKLFLGHPESGAYTRGTFLRLPPHIVVEVNGTALLIGGVSLSAVEKTRQLLLNKIDPTNGLALLFSKKFDHLTVADEYHVGGSTLIQRKTVLRYSVLPSAIYDSPEALSPYLNHLVGVMSALGVKPLKF